MSLNLLPQRRRALTWSVAGGAAVTALLGFGAPSALANYSGRVVAGTFVITGDATADKLRLLAAPGTPSVLLADVGDDGTVDFSLDSSQFNAIEVRAGGGDDQVAVDNSVSLFIPAGITIDGGTGNDRIIGGAGGETIDAGTGNDFVDGNIGSDVVRLGAGNDHFQWDPGDGSDAVDGGAGDDALDFNGSNIGEAIEVLPNGGHVQLTRNVASIAMDLDGIDRLNLRTLGGADTVRVGNLTGTDLKTSDVDLAAFDGAGDASADTVTAEGTVGPDRIDVTSAGGRTVVTGPAGQVRVAGGEAGLDNVNVAAADGADKITSSVAFTGPEAVNVDGGDGADQLIYKGTNAADAIGIARSGPSTVAVFTPAGALVNMLAVENLVVQGLSGDDVIAGQNGIGGLTSLTVEGGAGNDDLRGGDGADTLDGAAGDDSIDGNIGADVAELGGGNDRFQWDPGDGSDSVDGQGGNDVLDFNGSNASEDIAVAANGSHVRLTRNVAQIAMDFTGIEQLRLRALGGVDTIGIGDLSGTALKANDIDLAAFDGTGDQTSDTVTVLGRQTPDSVQVTRSGGQVRVAGLPAETRITGSEAGVDLLRVDTLGGDDEVTVASDVSDVIVPFVDLGDGE